MFAAFRIKQNKACGPAKTRVHGVVQGRTLAADGDYHSHLLFALK
jgi:hypothetical protein